MTKTLSDLRVQIDALDLELLSLLNRRAGLAHEVGELKKGEGSVVFRPEREAQVIGNLQEANAQTRNTGTLKPESVAFIWREIMSACRALEAPQRVASRAITSEACFLVPTNRKRLPLREALRVHL